MDGTGVSKRVKRRPARGRANSAETRTKVINLALQGGGAHGAFTWGVLDALLEDERIASRASARQAPVR